MFGAPGRLYVYAIHAKHCLNFVTESEGLGAAVLVRALQPVWAIDLMKQNRSLVDEKRLTSGPGMLCQAMKVDRHFDGMDAIASSEWQVKKVFRFRSDEITATPRIGVTDGKDLLMRFIVDGNRYVSGPGRDHQRKKSGVLAFD